MTNLISRFVRDESGATAIEYGLIAALIAVVIITGLDHGRHELEHEADHDRHQPALIAPAGKLRTAAPQKAAVRSFRFPHVRRSSRSGRAAAASGRRRRLGSGEFHHPQFPASRAGRLFCRLRAGDPSGRAGIGLHLLAGFIGLAMGFTLFALGYIGGGDAKLFAAVRAVAGASKI